MKLVRLSRYLLKRAERVMESRKPDFLIGPQGDPYMQRWWLIPRNRVFNIYLHRILHDDDDRALHDHPWPSVSIMLKGKLGELYRGRDGQTHVRKIQPGRIIWRGPWFAHRLTLWPEFSGLMQPFAVTIFITGPRVREWGFHCPKGWRHWKEFTAPADRGQIGRGCD
ncbi:MAG: hypothetical protein H6883_07140 [Rhodobiaceae bacterium]|nr:hypothetical protein [Rhodobiaceae bacterium]MCC0055894.1 hypothetical protein [Rhodobiaceae bacterium]